MSERTDNPLHSEEPEVRTDAPEPLGSEAEVDSDGTGIRERTSAPDRSRSGVGAVVFAFQRLFARVLDSRYRISTQIYLAFGGAVLLTIAASLVGWFSFDRVGIQQARVNEGSVPEMTAAFGIAQLANILVDAGPRLAATTNTTDFQAVAADISAANVALVGQLALLQGQHTNEARFNRMRSYLDELTSNNYEIQTGMVESFLREVLLEQLRADIADVDRQLRQILAPAADDQWFYMMTGYRDPEQPPAAAVGRLNERELSQYRHLAALVSDTDYARQTLESGFGVSDPSTLEPLRESFESAISRMNHNLGAIRGLDLGEEIEPLIATLSELGLGEQGSLDLLDRHFRVLERRSELLAQNRSIAVELLKEVDGFVGLANASVEDAAVASDQAVFAGKIVLAALSVVSVGGAALIAWLFIGRILLSRLQILLGSMRQMADGDLDVEVDTSGRDEVSEMANALEVFRKASLDALELDEVRRLNDQLEQTNEELTDTVLERDSALDDLQRAQNQIVERDKLAAIGELTAGVAHEIRNPLNFIKNFAEGSEEILEELTEVIDEAAEEMEESQRDLVVEISGELKDSLNRIQSNTNRAERIVRDMLLMSRGASEPQLTDINSLVEENARLSFHSARATNSDFQLDLVTDFDPDAGQAQIIPQDMGRVIINMVTNAGFATNEKRMEIGDETFDAGSYMPTVFLATKRLGDEIEIRIKDNGTGIPTEVMDSIFNPFFTTKDPNQGTGLGLALCADIIRQHGGSISVETEPGEFTEMTIVIPTTQPVIEEAESDMVGV